MIPELKICTECGKYFIFGNTCNSCKSINTFSIRKEGEVMNIVADPIYVKTRDMNKTYKVWSILSKVNPKFLNWDQLDGDCICHVMTVGDSTAPLTIFKRSQLIRVELPKPNYGYRY